jgi:hypothetical protein
MGVAGHVTRTGDRRSAYTALLVRREGKRALGRPVNRWHYNIKMDLPKFGMGRHGLRVIKLRIGTGVGPLEMY